MALPLAAGAVRAAAADRHQPRQPQLHPRPPAREQRGRVPARPRLRRLHARLGDPRPAGRRQQPRDLRGRVPAARRGGGAPRDRLRGAHDRRLLPRRRALRPLRQRSRGRRRAQPRADGDAGRLRGDGPDGGRAARGQARPRAPHRRDRQRPGRGPLQGLLHARPDDDRGPAGDAAREPLERRVRARLRGDGAVGPRPGALPGRGVPRGRRALRPPQRADGRGASRRRARDRLHDDRRDGAQRDGRERHRRAPGGGRADRGAGRPAGPPARAAAARAAT